MLLPLLKRYFGYDTFRPAQQAIIEAVMQGRDCMALMPTGGGKSICYQLPALAMEGTALIVSPLIALMKDQVEALLANGIGAGALNSSMTSAEAVALRKACLEGRIKLLYMSPETVLSELPYLLADLNVSLIAVDEAHCVSQWGHDFRPEYTQLARLRQALPNVPMMALTATADKVTRQDILEQLQLRDPFISISSFDRPNLSLNVLQGYRKDDKLKFISHYLDMHPGESGIVYCLSRKSAEEVAKALRQRGIDAMPYHAGMSNAERERTQTDFIRDNLQVVCATIAFGMGIDKSNVRWVIHYNMPKSIEGFFQEIGRAGRDGAAADTFLFYSFADVIQLEKFARDSGQREINIERLQRMREYAEADVCRRRILLHYFGEEAKHDCGNCDVCKHPPQRFDATILAQKALSAVVRGEQRLPLTNVIDVLTARYTPTVRERGLDRLPTFGVGRDLPARDWQDYIVQMIQLGLLEIDYGHHLCLRLTPTGADVLYGRQPLHLAMIQRKEERARQKQERKERKAKATKSAHLPLTNLSADEQVLSARLFDSLRQLRKALAEQQGIKPYMVMSDLTLGAIAQHRPLTAEAFGQMPGIGDHKRERYAGVFTGAIRAFLRDHNLLEH